MNTTLCRYLCTGKSRVGKSVRILWSNLCGEQRECIVCGEGEEILCKSSDDIEAATSSACHCLRSTHWSCGRLVHRPEMQNQGGH